jgi:hypothetical protein
MKMRVFSALWLVLGFFLHDAAAGAGELAVWSRSGGCSFRRIRVPGQDPATGASLEVEGQEWVPARKEPRADRAVLIVPPTGGVTALDRSWAGRFCRAGARTFLLEHWKGDLETGLDPAVHDRGSLRGIAAIRSVVDFLGAPRTSVFGTSLGAILASMATGLDPRIDRAFLVVAGGSITDLLSESDQELLVRMRQDRMREFGLKTREEYRSFLAERLQVEPKRFSDAEAVKAGRKTLTFLIGTEDTTVPTRTQVELWEAWGRPGRVDVSHGHVGSILAAWAFYRADVVSHLLR